jgi:hypothetical protein
MIIQQGTKKKIVHLIVEHSVIITNMKQRGLKKGIHYFNNTGFEFILTRNRT